MTDARLSISETSSIDHFGGGTFDGIDYLELQQGLEKIQ
jgi:hypothetical protein